MALNSRLEYSKQEFEELAKRIWTKLVKIGGRIGQFRLVCNVTEQREVDNLFKN